MITSKPRLYYNTGITPNQVLAHSSLLNNASYRDFDDHIGLQDFFLTSFKLKATWDEVKEADYMKFGNAYYWITPKMINDNCCRIYCQLDALTSLGGALECTYSGGVVHRYQPATAERTDYFANIVDEPIGCSQILRARTVANWSMTNGNSPVRLIASTVDLSDTTTSLSPNTDQQALVFSGDIGITPGADKYTVVVPKPPAPAQYTTFYGFDSESRTVGFGLYDATNATVKKNLQYIRALGLSDAVLFSYEIPLGAVSPIVADANGHITSIGQSYASASGDLGWRTAATDSITSGFGTIPTGGDPTSLYYKTYSVYTSYVIRGRLSGDIKQFKASEIANNNTIEFMWVADPQFGGTSYCAPRYFYNSDNVYYRIANAAKGLPWKEVPISYNGASGSLWSKNTYAMQQGEKIRNGSGWDYVKNQTGAGILSNLAGLGSYMTAGLMTLKNGGSFEEYLQQMPANMDPRDYQNAKEKAAYLQSQVVAPELSCSPAVGLQSFIDNGFDIIKLMPTDSDAQMINDYFKRYGYAVPNKPFDISMMQTRNDSNYIEVSGVEIMDATVNAGKTIRDAAAAQLQAGCWVKHTL